MHTFSYKRGFIHVNFTDPKREIIHAQIDGYRVEVKSIHAAKLLITKYTKGKT
jgi:hypothetical protein